MSSVVSSKKGGFVLVAACMLLFAASDFSSWLSPETITQFMSYPDIGEESAGVLLTAELASIFITVLICSRFAGRYPFRLMALCGVVVGGLGQYSTSQFESFEILLLCRIATGCGIGLTTATCTMALASSDNPEKHYPKMYTFDMVSGGLLLYGFVWIKQLAGQVGIESYFLIVGGLFVFIGLIAVSGLPTKGEWRPTGHDVGVVELESLHFTNMSPRLLVVGTYIICIASAITYTYSHAIGHAAGIGSDEVNTVLGITTFFAILSGLLCMIVSGRANRILILALCCIVHALGNYFITHLDGMVGFGGGLALSIAAIYFVMPFNQGVGVMFDPKGGCSAAVLSAFPASFAIAGSLGGYLIANVDIALIGWLIVVMDLIAFVFCALAIILYENQQKLAKNAAAVVEGV